MAFLRMKPRRTIVDVAKVRLTAEEEKQERRRGLLFPNKADDLCSKVEPIKIELPDLSILRLSAESSCKAQQEQVVSETQVVVLKAFIHCQGCARRVRKTLSKLQGVSTFHVNMDKQKVTVIGRMSADDVLQNVNKVLKGTELWQEPLSAGASNCRSSPSE